MMLASIDKNDTTEASDIDSRSHSRLARTAAYHVSVPAVEALGMSVDVTYE